MVTEVHIDNALIAIRVLASKADSFVNQDFDELEATGHMPEYPSNEAIAIAIETAMLQLIALSEALGLHQLKETITATFRYAKTIGLDKRGQFEESLVWAHWSETVRQFADVIGALYGTKRVKVVSKDVIEVLRNSLYAITDPKCFRKPPATEDELHHRIEAVLRCVFPDLDHKPPIAKAVKNFIPDTGLPSLRTLIEYKFIQSKTDMARVADEILADTRGYKSNDWDSFIFVIYETKRLKPERDWNRLLQQCDTAVNTQAIVLLGEKAPGEMSKQKKQRKDSKGNHA